MPYNPGISYTGAQSIAQGIGSLGATVSDDINKGVARYQEIQKQKAYGDTVMEHLAQTPGPNGQPYVPVDALNKYHSAGLSAQQGMVTAAQANFANDIQQQTAARQADLERAQANYYQAHGNYMNAHAAAEGGGGGPIKVDPVVDPATGKTTPGVGLVRKTGAVVSTAADQGQVQMDPTGKFFFDNKSRSWKPLPAATMVLPGMTPSQGAPTGQPGLPANPGMTPGAPPLMPQAGAGAQGNPILDQAREAIASGAPKAAVIARLQQMGVDPAGL